jgi:hypothetical protein
MNRARGGPQLWAQMCDGPSGGGTYRREVAIDELTFNADGTIRKVVPSSGLSF